MISLVRLKLVVNMSGFKIEVLNSLIILVICYFVML